jgi:hypothetical protein
MKQSNPIFKQNYNKYLEKLDVDEPVTIPFFNNTYHVSKSGVADDHGNKPDYMTCVILLKYVLMAPSYVPAGKEWIPYREFKDAGKGQNEGLATFAIQKLSSYYSGRLDDLKIAVERLQGRSPEEDYPYDICSVIPALPNIPVLFLFNDADEFMPSKAMILYERRAEYYLDAECRVMVDWCLFEHLKQAELSQA